MSFKNSHSFHLRGSVEFPHIPSTAPSLLMMIDRSHPYPLAVRHLCFLSLWNHTKCTFSMDNINIPKSSQNRRFLLYGIWYQRYFLFKLDLELSTVYFIMLCIPFEYSLLSNSDPKYTRVEQVCHILRDIKSIYIFKWIPVFKLWTSRGDNYGYWKIALCSKQISVFFMNC